MDIQISPSENEIMRVIWKLDGKITVAPLMDELIALGKQWKSNTVVTFLSRLVEKGLLTVEKNGRNNTYTAVLSETEFKKQQMGVFVKEAYDGNVGEFIAQLLEQWNPLVKDIKPSDITPGKAFVQRLLSNEREKKANLNTDEIVKELGLEIASRKTSINLKRVIIVQLESEIEGDKERMKALNVLLERLNTVNENQNLSGGAL